MRTVNKKKLNSNSDDASDQFLSAKRLHTRPPSCSTRARLVATGAIRLRYTVKTWSWSWRWRSMRTVKKRSWIPTWTMRLIIFSQPSVFIRGHLHAQLEPFFTDGSFIYVIDFFLKSNPVLDFFRPSCGFLIKNTTGITISHLKT